MPGEASVWISGCKLCMLFAWVIWSGICVAQRQIWPLLVILVSLSTTMSEATRFLVVQSEFNTITQVRLERDCLIWDLQHLQSLVWDFERQSFHVAELWSAKCWIYYSFNPNYDIFLNIKLLQNVPEKSKLYTSSQCRFKKWVSILKKRHRKILKLSVSNDQTVSPAATNLTVMWATCWSNTRSVWRL